MPGRMLDEIRARYPLACADDDGLRLVLGVEGVRVGIRVRVRSGMLVVTAFLAGRTAIDPMTALAVNAHLIYGALTVDGGDLLLRSVLLDGQSTAVEHVERVATEAALLKVRLRRAPADWDVFDAYSE
jgi:hypothetical protein